MFEETTTQNLESTTATTIAEENASSSEGPAVARAIETPQVAGDGASGAAASGHAHSGHAVSGHTGPEPAASDQEEKTAAASEDFAAALENFEKVESEEAAAAAAGGDEVIIKGTVLKITGTHVVVDIGAKSEGMLPLSEVLDHEGQPKFQPGAEIDVMREKGETEEGYIKLSHQKAQRLRAWDEIEKAHNEKRPKVKNGLPREQC